MLVQDNWRYKKHCRGYFSDIAYLEWKYFSFTSDNIDGFFCYSIGNPNDVLGLKKCILSYGIYFEDDVKLGYFEVPKKECFLGGKGLWKFGDSFIKKIGDDSWRIKGVGDELEVDLTFKAISGGGEIITDFEDSIFGDIWMNWIVFCNSAEVKGKIKNFDNDQTYKIQGVGYYDSNLGHWIPSDYLWVWGNVISKIHDSIISFTLAESRGTNVHNGKMYISIDNKVTPIEFREYELIYDSDDSILPDKYIVNIKSDKKKIKAEIIFYVDVTNLLKIRAFNIFPLIDIFVKRGNVKVKITHPDLGHLEYEDKAAWEFPMKSSIF